MGVELFEPTDVRIRNLVGFPIVDADVAVGANINADKIGTGVVDNTEFDRLNGITSALEEQGNKGAVSGYAGLDAFQELLLANFPSGAALQVLRRDVGNVALEFSTPVSALDDLSDVTLAGPAADADFLIFDTVGSAFKDIQITGDVLITKTGVATIQANAVNDGKIVAHVSTKITINAKGQLNSNIVYTDQANIFGDFDQTFKDNRLRIENPAGDFEVQFQTSAEGADRVLTIPLLGANRTMVVIGLSNQLTNTELTAGAFVKITGVGTLTSGTWNATTIAIADGGTGQTTQQAAINALTNVAAATNEHVLTKDTGTGDAIFKAAAGGAGLPVVDTTSIAEGSADATKEVRFEVDGNTTGIVGIIATIFTTAKTVTLPDATDTLMGKATTDIMINKSYDLGGAGNVLTGSVAEFNTALQADTFAFISDNLSVFAATTSLQLLGVISDETGTGLLVFNDTPTIITPTIASFANATHSHLNAAGGGTITKAAISDTPWLAADITLAATDLTDTADLAFLNQVNTFGAFLNSFVTSTMRISLSATPTMAVDGDFAIDTTITDFTMGLIKYFDGEEMVIVSIPVAETVTPTGGHVITYNATNDEFELIAAAGGSDTPWTVDHVAAGFDLNDLSNLEFRDPSDSVSGPTINAIYVEAAGMVHNVPTGNNFAFSVNDVDQMTLDITALTLAAGNNIILQASGALGLLTMGELTTPATPGANTGSFYVKDVGAVSTAFFIGDDGVEKNLTTGVGDDLGDHTATEIIKSVTFGLQGEEVGHTIIATTASNAWTHNVPTGDTHIFNVNAVDSVTIGAAGTNITVSNSGAGGDPILFANDAGQNLDITGGLQVSGTVTFGTYVGQTSIVTLGTITAGTWTGTAIASANLDADTAHLTTNQTFSGDKTFSGAVLATAGTMRIPLSATPTMAVDGDFAIDTTVTDFSHGIMKYFDGEELGVVSMPITQFVTPTGGHVVSYNATNDEFELIASAGGNHNLLDGSVHPDTVAQTITRGSIIYGNVTPLWDELTIGTANQVLQSDGTDISWGSVPNSGVFTDEIKAVMEVPQSTVAFPDIISMVTSSAKVSGLTFPDGVSEGQINAKVIVPANIAATPNAKIVLKVMTITANTSNETRWEVKSRNVSDGTDMDVAFTVDTAGTDLTMAATAETMEILEINMNTAPSAGDEVLILVKRKSNVASDDYAASVHLVEVSLKIDRVATTTNIVFTNQANIFGDFDQTFKDNRLRIENPAGTFDVVLQTSAEITSDRILTIPLLGANRTMVVTGLTSQITIGTEVTGAITDLSDVTAKTGTGTTAVFDTSPTIVTPTIASFVNATHDHTAGAGGGLLTNTALTSGVFAAISGLGAQSQTLDMGANILQFNNVNETIQVISSIMTFDVADTFSHAFRINNVNELTITGTAINAPTAAFQEAGVAISTIGTHDDYYDAGMMVEVTSAIPDATIIGTTTNRKGVLKMDFLNGADEFATIKLTPPRNWDASTITVIFKWTTGAEGAGIVRWGIAGVAVADLDDLNAAATNYGAEIFVTDTQTSINQEQFSPRTAAITLANTPTAGDSVYLRIQRTGADAGDTFDQIAFLLGIFIEWGLNAATAT